MNIFDTTFKPKQKKTDNSFDTAFPVTPTVPLGATKPPTGVISHDKKTTISENPQNRVQAFLAKLPEPIKKIGQDLKEGLVGRGQVVDITGQMKFDSGLVGFQRPFGIGKPIAQKVLDRSNLLKPLIEQGKITPQRADKISQSVVPPANQLRGLPPLKPNLKLTSDEKRALRPIVIEETLDKVFGALDIVSLGTIKPITKTAAQKIAKSKVANEIIDILTKEIPDLAEDTKQLFGKILTKIDNPDDVQRVLNRTNLAVQKANEVITPYKETGDLTTNTLKQLEGKTTVSKQFISDLTNRPELKQTERDLIRRILDESGDTSPLTQEAKKYKSAEEFVKARDSLPVKEVGFHGTQAKEIRGTPNKTKGTMGNAFYLADSLDEALKFGTDKGVVIGGNKMRVSGAHQKANKFTFDLSDLKIKRFKNDAEFFDFVKDPDIERWFRLAGYDGAYITRNGNYAIYNTEKLKQIPTKSQLIDIWNKAKSSDTINVSDFANKVKAELLPLKVNDRPNASAMSDKQYRYENITLPDDIRGSVKNYKENIYESPIQTSAGGVHFGSSKKNYFGHTRVEDMADNQTRRVIEVQSDLYQKGRLEGEEGFKAIELGKQLTREDKEILTKVAREAKTMREFFDNVPGDSFTGLRKLPQVSDEALYNFAKEGFPEKASIQKLQQYNDPTAHFRMVREEIKKAAQDGKTKLQFPTGETAMKIEGLGQAPAVQVADASGVGSRTIRLDELKIGKEIRTQGNEWIITDVLGDGKFKAVPKDHLELSIEDAGIASETLDTSDWVSYVQQHDPSKIERYAEQFDISGKVDTNNPIYKFYEKDVQKYLNKFGGKRVVDEKGVSWIEVPIKKESGTQPIEAFKFFGQDEFDLTIPQAKTVLRNLFDEDELSFIFTKKLINGRAVGSFSNKFINLINLVESGGKVQSSTLFHEAFHAYFNTFIPETTRKAMLAKVKKSKSTKLARSVNSFAYKGGEDVVAEEWLADDFARYIRDISNNKKPTSVFVRIWRAMWKELRTWIRKKNQFEKIYNDIITKKRTGFRERNPITDVRFKEVSDADRLIAENKIRVVSRDGKDVYQIKKGNEWVNTRDEDSAVKQIKNQSIKKEIPIEQYEKQQYLEMMRESLANNPAKELAKYVSKTGDFKGELKEVTGTGASVFGKKGDDIVTELGFQDTEQAREAYNFYVKQKQRYLEFKKEVVSEKKKPTALVEQKPIQLTPVPKEEALSLENLAEQSLNRVDEPYRDKVSPLIDIIVDKNTPVNKKVGIIDYFRTPDRVLKKIGLGKEADALRVSYDNYLKELPKQLEVITEWSKRVSSEGNKRIFRWLDGQDVVVNETELKVAKEIKNYLQMWADRLDLPEDNRISHYITHIFDIGVKQKEFDEEIAMLIKDKVPGSVYDPFLEKRLGAKGYVEDTWRALDAYVKRATRKANMDPALEMLESASTKLEDSQLNYVTRLGARINMRPTEWDNLLDNTIKQLIGYRFGQRPINVISGTLRRMVYRGALGLNINSAIKNLTQGVNTFAKLGTRDTLNGYITLLKPGMSKELDDAGIFANNFIQDKTLSATKQFLQKADKGLWIMFQLAETINRGSAYFGAKAQAIRKGMSEEQAMQFAKKFVRDTQFVFGSIDTPVAMQGDIAKTIFQFGSFTQKQTEFLTEMAKNKEYAGIVRYIVASMAIVYTVGQVFNIQGKDFNPLNYFSRFGKPPALALPIEIFKAVTNMPNQYGKTPTTEQKIKSIMRSGTTLIPAGVQIKKVIQGDIISGNSKPKEKVTGTENPFNSF